MFRLERTADDGTEVAALQVVMAGFLGGLGYRLSGRAAVGYYCPDAPPAGELVFLASTKDVRDNESLEETLELVRADLQGEYEFDWGKPLRLDHIPLAALGAATSKESGAVLPVLVGADVQVRHAWQAPDLAEKALVTDPAELAAERLARLAENGVGAVVLADVFNLASLANKRLRDGEQLLTPASLVEMAATKQPRFFAEKLHVGAAIDMARHPDKLHFWGVPREQHPAFRQFFERCKDAANVQPMFRGRPGALPAPTKLRRHLVPGPWDDGIWPTEDLVAAEPRASAAPATAAAQVSTPRALGFDGDKEGRDLAAEVWPDLRGYEQKPRILKRSVVQGVANFVALRLGAPPVTVDFATEAEAEGLREARRAIALTDGQQLVFDLGAPLKDMVFDLREPLKDVVRQVVALMYWRGPLAAMPDQAAHRPAVDEIAKKWADAFEEARPQPSPPAPEVPVADIDWRV